MDKVKGTGYRLDRIGLAGLAVGYFRHPAVVIYLLLLPVSVFLALTLGEQGWAERLARLGAAALLTGAFYPVAWYLIHRFVLHSRSLYRRPSTAALWKRIHFDHHQDPNDLDVLFGAPHTTLPTLALLLLPLGLAVGGAASAAGAFAMGLVVTLGYEYVHCIQHLAYTPKSKLVRRIKMLHLLHHYHNENGNYGITNFVWDRVFRTYYGRASERGHSATVRNLGYAGEERARYPWVAELTDEQAGASGNVPQLSREG